MKKNIFLWILLFLASNIFAQTIPTDPSVKTGKLSNGLTYYIKKNVKPEKKVELRLIINAGSILEDDNQRGLAHFMEHMSFNGTKNFPKNKLVDYLQSIGVKFGNHLNAYTSFDETVYMLPIPLDKPENLTTGLKVLEDWAFNALLTKEEIDKERGVVLEELRMGLGPDKRMLDKYLPIVMKGSKYAERLPIGKKELLETFKPEVLQKFYKDWYRPDLMAVVVVGDIDVNDIEKRIKENFSKYKNPDNERPREIIEVPNHKETFVAIASDPDASFSNLQLTFNDLDNAKIKTSVADYNNDIVDNLLFTIINNRLQELADSATPPFTYGYVYHGGTWARSKEAFQGGAMTQEGKQTQALKVLLEEIERVKLYGVTQSELDRAKTEMLSSMEKSYNDRDKTESRILVEEYKRNFLNKEPIPEIEWEYNQYKQFIPTVSLEQVNSVLNQYVRDDNRVVVITGPDKPTITQPKDSEVLAIFDQVKNSKLEKYDDKVAITELVKTPAKKGSITKTEKDAKLGTTTWTLSNGAKVTFKKTDFKNDEILFQAQRKGGQSILSDNDVKKTQWAYSILDEAGINNYTKTDLNKYLSGKVVRVSPFFSNTFVGLGGQSTPKDLKTLFELTYSYFTGLNYDETAYKSAIEKQSAIYNNLTSQPMYYFQSEFIKFRQKNNPRFTSIVPLKADWDNTDFKLAYNKYKDFFSNAGDFEFFFIGNIDEAQLKDYAETYLATLPSTKTITTFKDNGYRAINSADNQTYKKGKDPKSYVQIIYSGEIPKYNEKEAKNFDALGEVLTIKLIEILRESESGVYSTSARASMNPIPYPSYSLSISIPCGPENVEKLTKSALELVKSIVEKGPEQKDVDKYKQGELNELRDNLKKNDTWLDYLTDYPLKGGNKYLILEEESLINGVTAKGIQEVAKKYLTKNRIIATLMPEDGSEAAKPTETAKAATKSAVSAQQVINNYLAALGGKTKLESVKTLYTETSTEMMGMTMPSKEKRMAPNKVWSEIDMMGQKITKVFDGTKGYFTQNGAKEEIPADIAETMKKGKVFDALAYDASQFKTVEEQTVDGKDYYVLTDEDGTQSYFDKSSGLLYKEVSENTAQVYDEYKDFDGIKFAVSKTIDAGGQQLKTKTTVVEINKNVSEADFK